MHNKKLFDLIGAMGVRMNGVCEGFQILRHITSSDWLLYLREVLEFRLSEETNQHTLRKDALHLVDIDGHIIKADATLYKEVYTVGKKMFHKLYVTFSMS